MMMSDRGPQSPRSLARVGWCSHRSIHHRRCATYLGEAPTYSWMSGARAGKHELLRLARGRWGKIQNHLPGDRRLRGYGWGRSGSSDRYDLPLEQAVDAIQDFTRQALLMAGVIDPKVAGCFGLQALIGPKISPSYPLLWRNASSCSGWWSEMMQRLRCALEHPRGYGVVVSAGTHLAAAIRTPDGQEWHSAWFSVEGAGGVTVGHQVLWAVLKAEDGRGQPTVLTDLVLEAKNLSHPLELLRLLSRGGIDVRCQASLAPLYLSLNSSTPMLWPASSSGRLRTTWLPGRLPCSQDTG